MNPLNWRREHQVALLIIAFIGALIGLLTSFWADYVFLDINMYFGPSIFFFEWLKAPLAFNWWPWPLFGAVITGGAFYALRLLRN